MPNSTELLKYYNDIKSLGGKRLDSFSMFNDGIVYGLRIYKNHYEKEIEKLQKRIDELENENGGLHQALNMQQVEKKEFNCKLCKDTGIIKYKPLNSYPHFQWTKWQERKCTCKRS